MQKTTDVSKVSKTAQRDLFFNVNFLSESRKF